MSEYKDKEIFYVLFNVLYYLKNKYRITHKMAILSDFNIIHVYFISNDVNKP